MVVAELETAPSWSRQHTVKKASLYVGDLGPDVTEEDLIVKFSSKVPLVSAHLCRCSTTGKSLCYGFVNFATYFNASNALACLNHTEMKGQTIRVMWCDKEQSQRRSGIGNLFVKNLDRSITSSCLERIFSPFGCILSCKVVEQNGQSKGFGFVQFDSERSAAVARAALHGTLLDGKKLYVAKFIKNAERSAVQGKHDFTNLYVKNLVEEVTEDFLLKTFSVYGRVCSVVVMRDETGKSRGFGFVSFFDPENARKATEALNGAVLGSKNLYVGRAQNKAERTEMLKRELGEKFISGFETSKRLNLYVKNLSESIDETRLREIFGRCGRIVSARVMRHEDGLSKGFGFVRLSNRQESKQAKRELNGAFVDGKSLFVRVAERKEDRQKRLQRYFTEPSAQSPDGFVPRVPSGSYAYIQPLFFGQIPFYISSYLPVGQARPKETGNAQDLADKRMVKITPSVYASVTGKTSGSETGNVSNRKAGFRGEGNKCPDAEVSSRVSMSTSILEEATSVLKAALLKSPRGRGYESRED